MGRSSWAVTIPTSDRQCAVPSARAQVAGVGGPVVLARRPLVGSDEPRGHPGFTLEAGEGGVDGAGLDVVEAALVQALHDLVPVRLLLGQQVQQQDREHALEQLRVVGSGHMGRVCLLAGYV